MTCIVILFEQRVKADIILRGYYGWNSTRALEVVDKVFPKVLFFWFFFLGKCIHSIVSSQI